MQNVIQYVQTETFDIYNMRAYNLEILIMLVL